jgi:aminomethyltransferase
MGHTFPGPGLFSKFYDVDHEPLIEVVRDTVGIHDTFNLACTSNIMKMQDILVMQIVLII